MRGTGFSILLIFLFLISLLFIGYGVTGFYLLDWQQSYCSQDKDCNPDLVCCKFYEEDSGVCDSKGNCKAIYDLTKEEKQQRTATALVTREIDKEFPLRYWSYENIAFLVLGVIILISAFLLERSK